MRWDPDLGSLDRRKTSASSSTSVDRITPRTNPADTSLVQSSCGYPRRRPPWLPSHSITGCCAETFPPAVRAGKTPGQFSWMTSNRTRTASCGSSTAPTRCWPTPASSAGTPRWPRRSRTRLPARRGGLLGRGVRAPARATSCISPSTGALCVTGSATAGSPTICRRSRWMAPPSSDAGRAGAARRTARRAGRGGAAPRCWRRGSIRGHRRRSPGSHWPPTLPRAVRGRGRSRRSPRCLALIGPELAADPRRRCRWSTELRRHLRAIPGRTSQSHTTRCHAAAPLTSHITRRKGCLA